jgi:hypothetical protein
MCLVVSNVLFFWEFQTSPLEWVTWFAREKQANLLASFLNLFLMYENWLEDIFVVENLKSLAI